MRLSPLLLLFLVWLASCAPAQQEKVNWGVINLSSFDFTQGTLALLDGVWEFTPDSTASAFVEVPGLWRDHEFQGAPGPVFGSGTYRLHIRLPASTPPLRLYCTNLQSASVVSINGVRVGGREQDLPYTVAVPPGEANLDLKIHVTNKNNSQGGGVLASQRLGSAEAIARFVAFSMISEVLVTGLFVFMALFTLILFLLQRRDMSLLVFTAVALCFAARQFFIGETLGFFAVGIPFDVILRGQESPAFFLCGFLTLYFHRLFPQRGLRLVTYSLLGVGLGFAAVVWLAPTELFTATLPVAQILVFVTIGNALAVVFHAWSKQDPLAPSFLVVVLFLSLPAAIEALFADLALPQLTTLGFLPFLVFQSYLLARRFSANAVEAETLRMTNILLKEQDQAKTNFLANISHELRTPIALIQAPIEALVEGEYGTTIANTHPVFTLVLNNARRLLTLTERLLHLTKLEKGESVDLRPVDYPKLVRTYLSEFESLALQAEISLGFEEPNPPLTPLVVCLDVGAFETILFNFMSNALKFTPPQGRITVRLGFSPAGLVRLEVIDTGSGLDPDVAATLFVRYRKIYDHPRDRYDGHGIGLVLAKEAAQSLNGEVGVSSEKGRGSCFWFDLPLSAAKPDADPASAAFPALWKPTALDHGTSTSPPQFPQGRILVVEDNQELRQFIAATLSDYVVIQACDGHGALEELAKTPLPDLILSDIMMPGMGGVELFEHTRNLPSLAAIPFLFLTARAEIEQRSALLSRGLIEYIVKPFSVRELRTRVNSVLVVLTNERRAMEGRLLEAIRSVSPGSGKPSYPSDASPREVEVLEAVVAGKTDKEIAHALGISTRTASNHVASLLRKTGLASRQSLRQRYQ